MRTVPHVAKTDAAVREHLKAAGFTGYTWIDTSIDDDGRAATFVRRSHQAAPWTPRLLGWLVESLGRLPDSTRPMPHSNGQAIVVTWRGVPR